MPRRFPSARLPAALWLAAGLALAGLPVLAARGSDRADSDLTPEGRPLDGPRAAKMAELAAAAERVRGLKLKSQPSWNLRSQREVYRFFLRTVQAEVDGRRIELGTKLYAAFGFWKPDFDLLSAELEIRAGAVRAFYSSNEGTFTLVASSGKASRNPAMALQEDTEIVHEYTHALQDQNLDLGRLGLAAGNDRAQAARALVEGDAVATMCSYLAGRVSGRAEPPPLDQVAIYIDGMRRNMGAMLQDQLFRKFPPIIGTSLVFSYTGGSHFVEAVLKHGGWAELDRCYQLPPLSTEQIIHPEKYIRPVPEDPVEIEMPEVIRPLLPGTRMIDADALGELEITVLLAGFVPAAEAREAAKGWGGDLYAALERTAGPHRGELVLAWLTAWDTEDDAREFFAAYARALDRKSGSARVGVGSPVEITRAEWPGSGTGREAQLERRGPAVLAVEGADAVEARSLSKVFWALKRRAPPPRQRSASE